MGVRSLVFSIAGWYFLPSICANILLSSIYRIFPNIRPKAKPHSSEEERSKIVTEIANHRRLVHIAVILAYLIYTIISAAYAIYTEPNYFQLLELPVDDIEDATLKSQWRRFARFHHPDKVGLTSETEAHFVAMRTAFETLGDDTKRDAYLRFGPELIQSCGSKCITFRDFTARGIMISAYFYIFGLAYLILLSATRRTNIGSYWRYISFFTLFSVEFGMVLSRKPLTLTYYLFPSSFTTFEQVSLLRSILVAFSCSITQLGPILFPSRPQISNQFISPEMIVNTSTLHVLSQLRQISTTIEAETIKLLHNEFQPLLQSPINPQTMSSSDATLNNVSSPERTRLLTELKGKMSETFVDLRLKATPEGCRMWEESVRTRRLKEMERELLSRPNKETPPSDDKIASDPTTSNPTSTRGKLELSKEDTKPSSSNPSAKTLKRKDSRIIQTPSPSPSPSSSPKIRAKPDSELINISREPSQLWI